MTSPTLKRTTPKRPENWIIIAALAAFFLIVGGVAGIPLFAKRLNGVEETRATPEPTPEEPKEEIQRRTYQQLCAQCAARRYWSVDGEEHTDEPAVEPTMLWIKTGGPKKECSHEWFNISGVKRSGDRHEKIHVPMDKETIYLLSDTRPGVDGLMAYAEDDTKQALATWGTMLRYCATKDDSYTPPFADGKTDTAPTSRHEITNWLKQNMSKVKKRLNK